MLAIRFLVLCLLASLAAATPAQVHRSDSGLGGALILPYWTAANNNDTLLSIRNGGDEASAARVRLLDSEGGLIQSFNLYLDARAVATSAISMFDGSPGILPFEAGCMLSGSVGKVAGSYSAIALDTMHGSIEVVEMARAASESTLVESGRWADCEVLADQFAGGDWSEAPNTGLLLPAQRLSASASVINVRAGTMNVVAATALAGFSDIAQHSAPDSQSPDLSDAHDSQAPEGGTRSQVCTPEGCRIDEWSLPIEAVAAVLTQSSMRIDYSVLPAIGASFEWMIHRPLERYEDAESGFAIDMHPTLTIRRRNGRLPESGGVCIPAPPMPWMPPCGTVSDFPLDRGLIHQNLAFNARFGDVGDVIDSDILGHPTIVRPAFALGDTQATEFHEGSVEFRLYPDGEAAPMLVAADGTVFAGEPLISFAIQQYSNGTLTGPQGQAVLANYRGTKLPRGILYLEGPD